MECLPREPVRSDVVPLSMLRNSARFFVALTLGLAFAHVLEIPGKLRLDGPDWLTVQHNLYIAFGVVGAGVELLAIGLTWALVWRRRNTPDSANVLCAAVCVTLGLTAWALIVAPVNAILNHWTAETLPQDWWRYRDRWEFGHAIQCALFAGGFILLLHRRAVTPWPLQEPPVPPATPLPPQPSRGRSQPSESVLP